MESSFTMPRRTARASPLGDAQVALGEEAPVTSGLSSPVLAVQHPNRLLQGDNIPVNRNNLHVDYSAPDDPSGSFPDNTLPNLQRNNPGMVSTTGFVACKARNCNTCNRALGEKVFSGSYVGKKYPILVSKIDEIISCNMRNVVYLLTCNKCNFKYVGETGQLFKRRMGQHIGSIRSNNGRGCFNITKHFNSCCKIDDIRWQIIEKLLDNGDKSHDRDRRLERELFWIRELKTKYPFGLNDKLTKYKNDLPTMAQLCNKRDRKRGKRTRQPRRNRERIDLAKFMDEFYDMYSKKFEQCMPNCYKKVFSLSKPALRRVRLALDEYTHDEFFHNFLTDLVDSFFELKSTKNKGTPSQRRKNLLIVHYNNKAMDFLNLGEALRCEETTNAWPLNAKSQYITPMVCFSYEKPIRSFICNYRQFIADIDWDNLDPSTLPCCCERSPLRDQHFGHIITGDVDRLVRNVRLQELLKRGPKFRLPKPLNFAAQLKEIHIGLNKYVDKIVQKSKTIDETGIFKKWIDSVLNVCSANRREVNRRLAQKYGDLADTFQFNHFMPALNRLKTYFVITPVDKANQNFAFICKKLYFEQLALESKNKAYRSIVENGDSLISRLKDESTVFGVKVDPNQLNLPFLYLIPKFHKSPIAFRPIVSSAIAVTKPVSKTLGTILKLVSKNIKAQCNAFGHVTNRNYYWPIDDNRPILEFLNKLSTKKKARSINTFDFTSLYTTLQHAEIFTNLEKILKRCFGKSYDVDGWRITALANKAFWQRGAGQTITDSFNGFQILEMLNWLISNTYFNIGNKIFCQIIGIPMGTDCAPQLANLHLHQYEYDFLMSNRYEHSITEKLQYNCRFIDDLSSINDMGLFEKIYSRIYPVGLELKKINSVSETADVLDIHIQVDNGKFITSLYDKRSDFNFEIIKFPHTDGNFPEQMCYNVFAAQIVRFARINSEYVYFLKDCVELMDYLRTRGYSLSKLRKKFYSTLRKHKLILKKYGGIHHKNVHIYV